MTTKITPVVGGFIIDARGTFSVYLGDSIASHLELDSADYKIWGGYDAVARQDYNQIFISERANALPKALDFLSKL